MAMSNISESLPDLSLVLGVDGENEVCVHVWFQGGRDDHILSRLQAVVLNQVPLIAVILVGLHRLVPPEEQRTQAAYWRLVRT